MRSPLDSRLFPHEEIFDITILDKHIGYVRRNRLEFRAYITDLPFFSEYDIYKDFSDLACATLWIKMKWKEWWEEEILEMEEKIKEKKAMLDELRL